MKKQNYPSTGEVESLIDATQKLDQLRGQRDAVSTRLREIDGELRSAIAGALFIENRRDKPLDSQIAVYQRVLQKNQAARDGRVEFLLKERGDLLRKHESITDEIKKVFPDLKARVTALCEKARQAKHAEYDALLEEIVAKLAPYCDGDEEGARFLGQQTAKAVACYTKAAACSLNATDPENLVGPLKHTLSAITS